MGALRVFIGLSKRLAAGAKLFFGLLTAVLGSPWWLIAWYFIGKDKPKGSLHHSIFLVILGFSFIGNAAIFFGCIHGPMAILQGELVSWEWGYSGWTTGMLVLIVCDMIYLRSQVLQGKDGDKAENQFCALLLRPFGVKGVEQAGGSYQWSFPLVALLGAQIFFFAAEWLNTSNPLLLCNISPINGTDAINCPPFTIYSQGAKHCCIVDDRTFIATSLIGQVGGNILAGYGFVKSIAWFILWGTDDVAKAADFETTRNDIQDEEIMLIVRAIAESPHFDGLQVKLLAQEAQLVARRMESQLAKQNSQGYISTATATNYTFRETSCIDKALVDRPSVGSRLNAPLLQSFRGEVGGGMQEMEMEADEKSSGLQDMPEARCKRGELSSGTPQEDAEQQTPTVIVTVGTLAGADVRPRSLSQ
jgi:hypothetical protein